MFWSRYLYDESGMGWHPDGNDIVYEPSPYTKETNILNPKQQKSYMQLSFVYTFKKEFDEVYCAYTVPYSYT